jgi:FdhD protein
MHQAISWSGDTTASVGLELVGEEPLAIRIQGRPYSVIMRTPGDEIAHAAGFCLGEGLVDRPGDISAIGFCEDDEANVVTVTLTEARREKISTLMDRRGFVSQTSCGICGKEVIADLRQMIAPVRNGVDIDLPDALSLINRFSELQPMRQKTHASHAAAIYDSDLSLLAAAEDAGRHNALDKAVGRLFLDGCLDRAALLLLSSRISYELVQKAARAGIPAILAISRPTTLAVELARELNLSLACLSRVSDLYLFCGTQRFRATPDG